MRSALVALHGAPPAIVELPGDANRSASHRASLCRSPASTRTGGVHVADCHEPTRLCRSRSPPASRLSSRRGYGHSRSARCSRRTILSAQSPSIAKRFGHLRISRSSLFRILPIRLSSRSRTPDCSTSCATRTASSRARSRSCKRSARSARRSTRRSISRPCCPPSCRGRSSSPAPMPARSTSSTSSRRNCSCARPMA